MKQMHLETYKLTLVSESPRTNLHQYRYRLEQALVSEWTYIGVFISLHCCLQPQLTVVSASAGTGVKINQQSELCTVCKADACLHLWGSRWRHRFSMCSTSKHGLKPKPSVASPDRSLCCTCNNCVFYENSPILFCCRYVWCMVKVRSLFQTQACAVLPHPKKRERKKQKAKEGGWGGGGGLGGRFSRNPGVGLGGGGGGDNIYIQTTQVNSEL